MDDVAAIRSENASLRRIQNKLVLWDSAESPLAPLTQYQTDVIQTLAQILAGGSTEDRVRNQWIFCFSPKYSTGLLQDAPSLDGNTTELSKDPISSMTTFLQHSEAIEHQITQSSDQIYNDYFRHLETQTSECDDLLGHIDLALETLRQLSTEYEFVATNTSTLHSESEKLILDQGRLSRLDADVASRLHHFQLVEQLLQKLDSPTLSVSGENFWAYVDQIDEGLEFLNSQSRLKDGAHYVIRYRQCLGKAATMIKAYIAQVLSTASEQVSRQSSGSTTTHSSDVIFALFYGKFKAFAARVRFVTDAIQKRRAKSPDYTRLMEALEQNYLDHRARLMSEGVTASIRDLASRNRTDHCAMTRLSCSFLVNVCLDEYHLFYEFFPAHDDLLTGYMHGLCGILYDQLRPCIIHINHLETLAEICSILRVEMLEEHVQHSRKTNHFVSSPCIKHINSLFRSS